MNEDEIQKALVDGKIPLNTVDKLYFALITCLAFFIIYCCIFTYDKWGLFTILWILTIGILFLSLLGYQTLRDNKKLIQYKSSLPHDKKTVVVEKLLTAPDLKPINKFRVATTPNFYEFDYSKSSRSKYFIQVFFDQSAYCVSSVKGSGKASWFSSDTANEIIDRIKKIEAEI